MDIRRFDVFLTALDPTVGREVKKTRPAVVISPDEINELATVIIAPMTTGARLYPMRVPCRFRGKHGQIVLEQLRCVDRARLVTRLGRIDAKTATRILEVLAQMFAP